MSSQESYQLIGTYDLKPVYISLGLPNSTFGTNGQVSSKGPFDTALDGGMQFPDSVWFFRGEDMQGGCFCGLRPIVRTNQWPLCAWKISRLVTSWLFCRASNSQAGHKAQCNTRLRQCQNGNSFEVYG